MHTADLPSLYRLQTRMKELNALFNVKELPDKQGVCESLELKLIHVL